MSLSGMQFEKFSEAIRDAYSHEELERLLRYRFDNLRLSDIAAPGNFNEVVFEVIDYFEREGTTDSFILATQQGKPKNPKLIAFSQEVGFAPENTPDLNNLEKLIRKTNAYLDALQFHSRLGELLFQVCQIELPDEVGTGLLIGPDLVLTNYHVVNEVIDETVKAKDVIIRFDYFTLDSGKVIDDGTPFRLHENWCVCYSSFSKIDLENMPKSGFPDPDELDFAILRLESRIGEIPIGKKYARGEESRGWMKFQNLKHKFDPGTPLFILQHPKGKRMKLALDTDSIIEENGNGTRVTYKTNTEGGSSGSPCFNQNLELVAIHHSGDPKKRIFSRAEWNEGIPVKAIVQYLERNNLKDILSN